MEIENTNKDLRGIEGLKREIERFHSMIKTYQHYIDKEEVYKKQFGILKDAIKASNFYQEVTSKEELVEFLDNITIEEASRETVMFYIHSRRNKDKRVLFRFYWKYNWGTGEEDISVKMESTEFQEPIDLMEGYTDLINILHFGLKPVEYTTVIMSVFFFFDKERILNSHEVIFKEGKEAIHFYRNMFSICHTKPKRKKFSNSS